MRALLVSAAICGLMACGSVSQHAGPWQRIDVGPGPEDLVLDTVSGHRIIASCDERRGTDMSRNGFYGIDPVTNLVTPIPVSGLPGSVYLNPHGIDIGTYKGDTVLYVVNHEESIQSILIFRLGADTLRYVTRLSDPLLVSPNDLCTDHRGGIYVSNDSGKRNAIFEKLFSLPRSNVVHFDGTKWREVATDIRYANGVGVLGGRLYVTGTQEKAVLSYSIGPDGALSDLSRMACPKGSDNITFHNGRLVSTAHLDFLAFVRHVKKPDHPSPGLVYAMDLQTGRVDTLFMDDGTTISAISTGLITDGRLFIAQVFNPYIGTVPAN